MEQTLLTDQDNALVYADAGEGRREGSTGSPSGPTPISWRRSFPSAQAATWRGRGTDPCRSGRSASGDGMDVPDPKALLVASIFFDYRRAGERSTSRRSTILAEAKRKTAFLHLFASASAGHPPQHLLLGLRGDSSDRRPEGSRPLAGRVPRPLLRAGGGDARGAPSSASMRRRVPGSSPRRTRRGVRGVPLVLGLRLRRELDARSRGAPVTTRISLAALSGSSGRGPRGLREIERWHGAAKDHFHVEF